LKLALNLFISGFEGL